MKRLSATVCAGLLAAAVLTGCGDDNGGGDSDSASGGDYCGQVEDFKGEFDVSGVAPGSGDWIGRVTMSRAGPGR